MFQNLFDENIDHLVHIPAKPPSKSLQSSIPLLNIY